MDILHVSATDTSGGASRAAYRIHLAQCGGGISSRMAVTKKFSNDPSVISRSRRLAKVRNYTRSAVEQLLLAKIFTRSPNPCSANLVLGSSIPRDAINQADLINLHFIGSSTIHHSLKPVREKPIVWTLHDMWPFSGVEHYGSESDTALWRTGSVAGKSFFDRIDRSILMRKKKCWEDIDLTVVCPSQWLAECAKSSSLFRERRVEVIPYALNLQTFRPIEKHVARALLGLEQDRRYILFGADPANLASTRKGGDLLRDALLELGDLRGDVSILLFGSSKQREVRGNFEFLSLGSFSDDVALSVVYNAADCFVAPSRQDNLPNTVIESLACGTPVVAFDVGGMPDMLDDNVGALAEPFSVKSLSNCLREVLARGSLSFTLKCRERAESLFAPRLIAEKYKSLYADILES